MCNEGWITVLSPRKLIDYNQKAFVYISEIKMHGFKSFANKEVMKLGQGITTVVGPNGCGKTNIVDAIRWV